MRALVIACLVLLALPIAADDQKVFQKDVYGNTQYNLPSWVVENNGRVVEVSPYGDKQNQKPGFQIRGDKVYQTDAYARIQHHKTSYTVQSDGRVIVTDAYGNKQYHKPQYEVKGDKVYQTDAYGNRKQQAYVVMPPPASPVTGQSKAKPKAK